MSKRIQEESGIPEHALKGLISEDFKLLSFVTLAMKERSELAKLAVALVVQLTEEIDDLRASKAMYKAENERLKAKIQRDKATRDKDIKRLHDDANRAWLVAGNLGVKQ